METLSISITALQIQALLWRTAAFALSCAGWTPTVIRNTAATGVTNDPLSGLAENSRYTHSQLVFIQGGWSARDDLKKIGANRNGFGSGIAPFAMAPQESSAECSAELFF
jgi:hypothetical protein